VQFDDFVRLENARYAQNGKFRANLRNGMGGRLFKNLQIARGERNPCNVQMSLNDDAHLDLLQVAVISIGAEEGRKVNLDGEKEIHEKLSTALEVIKLVVALEGMARRKMLEIMSPLSIDPNREIDIKVDAEMAKEVYSKLSFH
jgi:hypothetical protein